MLCFVDLHMHSCLSPCGDELMTPNNIVKMSALKGLHMIAVSDHNSAKQLPQIKRLADEFDMALLPAIELNTKEEVHLLAYFRTVDEALEFGEFIYPHLPDIKNRPEYFGEQLILNDEDEPVGHEDKLLISALDLSVDKLTKLIRERGGIAVPAHINRTSNGILNALGFLPPNLEFRVIEECAKLPVGPGFEKYKLLTSSDAHYITDILERTHSLELDAPTPDAFFDWAK